ncbi:MAG: hypothetical protein Q7T80_03830 [Methanoregula sp.]|nr:hypothetical protein [Methanoregula sp.]
MQFFQEFSIEQGVIFIQMGASLGFVWEFWGNGGRCVPGLERLLSLKKGGFRRAGGVFVLMGSYEIIISGFAKKTRMKSKTSHQSNENFALQTQFPFVCSIVRSFQNFHDKFSAIFVKNFSGKSG